MFLLRKDDGAQIRVGDRFYRYYPLIGDGVYDAGEVAKVNNDGVHVDFGDTMVSFGSIDIVRAINMALDEFQFTTIADGVIIADYRGSPNELKLTKDDEGLDDLLGILKGL